MRSHGGITGGETIQDALDAFEDAGYTAQFAAREGGDIMCFTCREVHVAETVGLDSIERIEGVSDPADETVVAAMVCPGCGARGTAAFGYGPMAPPEDAEAVRRIHDERRSESLAP